MGGSTWVSVEEERSYRCDRRAPTGPTGSSWKAGARSA
jgi:hypothetical protein